jgi:Cu-Zn family superoxide dismutase
MTIITTSARFALIAALACSGFACKKKESAPAEPPPAADTTPPPEPAKPSTPEPAAAATPPADTGAPETAGSGGGAEAKLEARSGSKVEGVVTLSKSADGKVVVDVKAMNLTPGEHGFHIHEKGDCSAPDAKSAGDHFNPGKMDHGAPDAPAHHAGDFGNLTAGADGAASMNVTVDFITLDDGPKGAIGRAFVVHEKADDLKTQPSGNAGARIACGVVVAK